MFLGSVQQHTFPAAIKLDRNLLVLILGEIEDVLLSRFLLLLRSMCTTPASSSATSMPRVSSASTSTATTTAEVPSFGHLSVMGILIVDVLHELVQTTS